MARRYLVIELVGDVEPPVGFADEIIEKRVNHGWVCTRVHHGHAGAVEQDVSTIYLPMSRMPTMTTTQVST